MCHSLLALSRWRLTADINLMKVKNQCPGDKSHALPLHYLRRIRGLLLPRASQGEPLDSGGEKQRFPWDFRLTFHLRDFLKSWWCMPCTFLGWTSFAMPRDPLSTLVYAVQRGHCFRVGLLFAPGKVSQPAEGEKRQIQNSQTRNNGMPL